jgi:uncharacterized protein YgbK (DUF1537 family)
MLLLGAIADDYTGGSDMAGMLATQGVRTLQTFGLPDEETIDAARGCDAVVISLKSRSIEPEEAVTSSLAAAEFLHNLDARQVQFKYCSTFDSTERGNIGPVIDALLTEFDSRYTIAVPALPVNGRTQYMGYLFVNGVLLSESHMRHHPLNPMTDANLVRHLQKQTSRRVGLKPLHEIRSGRAGENETGAEILLVDAIEEADLVTIAHAHLDMPLITGGSGITHALPLAWKDSGRCIPRFNQNWGAAVQGKTLLLAGSCSAMTLQQIEAWTGPMEAMRAIELDDAEVDRLETWCSHAWSRADAALIYSSAAPAERVPEAAGRIEQAFAEIARRLRPRYSHLVVAGGETSGAVVEAVGVRAVEIGAEIAPGVPALRGVGTGRLRLALKSGNFGAVDFFAKATAQLRS